MTKVEGDRNVQKASDRGAASLDRCDRVKERLACDMRGGKDMTSGAHTLTMTQQHNIKSVIGRVLKSQLKLVLLMLSR